MTNKHFQVMPPLSKDDYANLEASIEAQGVLMPVVVDEDGVIIDGYHRAEIAQKLGVEYRTETRAGLTDAEKRTLAYELNVDRRHLTRKQKHDLVVQSLKADPRLSDREHARRTGVTHPTVANVWWKLEQAGDVVKVTTRTDSAGRQQPASKPDVTVDETAPEVDLDAPPQPKPKPKRDVPKPPPADAEARPLDWDTIPGNQREKVKAAAAREAESQVKQLRRDADEQLKAMRAKYFADTLRATREAQDQLRKDREALSNGFWTPDEYNVIRSCLHPDSRASASDEKLAAAFRLFNDSRIKILLVKEKSDIQRGRRRRPGPPQAPNERAKAEGLDEENTA